MAIDQIFICDGPDCTGNVRTAADFPSTGFIRTYERWPGFDQEHHFCTWDCLLRFAAARPPVEIVGLTDEDDEAAAA
jgi:hypothetical protein